MSHSVLNCCAVIPATLPKSSNASPPVSDATSILTSALEKAEPPICASMPTEDSAAAKPNTCASVRPDLLARASHAVRHLHDGLFRGCKVVAQIDQRGADITELALAGAHDVGKLGDSGRSLVRAQVLAGIAQINHDAGEVGQMLGSDAQLTARRHDLVDLIGSRRDLGRHALGRSRQLVKLSFRCIHGLSNRCKRRFKSNGSLDCRCAEAQNGRSHDSGQCPARRSHFLADGVTLFPKGFEVLARFRPCGFRCVQLLIGLGNLGAGGRNGCLGAVQGSFRVNNGIRSLPDFLRIVGLLGGCQLFLSRPAAHSRIAERSAPAGGACHSAASAWRQGRSRWCPCP